MSIKLRLSCLLACFISFSALLHAQSSHHYFQKSELALLNSQNGQAPRVVASNAGYFNLDKVAFSSALGSTDQIIFLPNGLGMSKGFKAVQNTTMSVGLQEKFPEIISYNLVSTEGRSTWGKLSISPNGIHAMIFEPGKSTLFIDPLYVDGNAYIVYRKKDFKTDKVMNCGVESVSGPVDDLSKSAIPYNDCELKTYRLAIAATGEYTQFHGGTVADALAAMVVTMNRVNGIYERDFGVTMTLIENTDELIYVNSNTDPYSNGNTGAMINQNQSNIDAIIGTANYDIGHVFGTNSGGLAGLGVTCSSNSKARGVTGSGAPIGDPFDIDYVAHEMGHQFGGNHSFNNSCGGNRNNNTAMEPGSGSTIMAYAGICDPNVQNNSDDYFHGVNMREIGLEIQSDNCPVITSIDNMAPEIENVTSGHFIPASTPFALSAVVTDLDQEDELTYNWEQMNNQISPQPPEATSMNGPNFRSMDPDTLPTRYFPKLSSLGNVNSTTWERLPSVGRTMNFRLSVRDNAPNAGCTQFQNATVNVVATAGPFTVTYPSANSIVWDAFTNETVTWDVAGTDEEPISAALVDIFLSTDGGLTYPMLLADDVPNDGSYELEVPNAITNDARIMVMNSEGTFFDVSNNDFTINGFVDSFILASDDTEMSICPGQNAAFEITVQPVGTFLGTVTLSVPDLPNGVDVAFEDNTLTANQSTLLNISNTAAASPGNLEITVLGESASINYSITFTLAVNANVSDQPILLAPEDGADVVSTDPLLDWNASPSPDAVFEVQVATDMAFTNTVISQTGITDSEFIANGLDASTTYFWRVRKSTPCGVSGFSETFSFTTHNCFQFSSSDVPINISPVAATVTSSLNVAGSAIITDANVVNISGSHSRVGDLIFTLISPAGTEVTLAANICGSDENFNFGFDDASQNTIIDCPPTSGSAYQPEENLSDFAGEDAQGLWVLQIEDVMNGGGGSLQFWALELCFATGGSFVLEPASDTVSICQNSLVELTIDAVEVFDFDSPVSLSVNNLPEGVTADLSTAMVMPGSNFSIDFQASASANVGSYNIVVSGISGDQTVDLEITLHVNASIPEPAPLYEPGNMIEDVQTSENFVWEVSASPSATYELQLAFDDGFTDLFTVISGISGSNYFVEELPSFDTIYWRIITDNGCGTAISDVRSFTTLSCFVGMPDGLPINIIPVPSTYTSEVVVPFSGNIDKLRIKNLQGTHFRVSDLSVTLSSPGGTQVQLFVNICPDQQNFDLSFSDEGLSEIDCPPTSGLFYQPDDAFSAFAGENAFGTWTLTVTDNESGGGGSLDNWELELCFTENILSSENAEDIDLKIFPNPTEGAIRVQLRSGSNVQQLLLLDVSGRLISEINFGNDTEILLDLSTLASGLYFITGQSDSGNTSYKIIKR